MLWIALAAASQFSAPVPLNLKAWFTAGDMPDYMVPLGPGLWLVGIQLTITPEARIEGCEVTLSSGIAKLDLLTCETIRHRAKFAAASANRATEYGIYRTSIAWALADGPSPPPPVPRGTNPDLDLTVTNLPAGIKPPSLARVMFSVDSGGHMSSCIAEPGPSMERAENAPALVSVACGQILQAYHAPVARDAAGQPMPSVQDALVRFSIEGH